MSDIREIKRREFLQRTTAVAAVGVAGMVGMPSESLAAVNERHYAHRHFENLVGEKFVVANPAGGSAKSVKLVEAKALPKHRSDARPAHVRQEPFSLLFVADEPLEDAAHFARHERFGHFEIHLHPTRWDTYKHQHVYEAVFN